MADQAQRVEIEAEQIGIVYHSAVRSWFPLLVLLTSLAYLIGDHVRGPAPYVWAGTVYAIYLARTLIAYRALRRELDPIALTQHSAIVRGMTTLLGVLAGAGFIWFFRMLPAESQALVTMICVGWIAAAVGVSGAFPRFLLPWFAAFGISLVVAWWLYGSSHRELVAVLLALLVVFLWMTVLDLGKTTSESIRMRFENVDLLQALEQQKQKIQDAYDAKTRFMTAASHDLRQPLMSINLLYGSLMRATDPSAAMNIARKLGVPVRALESILDSLVEIARLDSGVIVPRRTPVDLSTLVNELEEEFVPVANAKDIAFHVRADHGIAVIDGQLTLRATRNLIDNAFKFTQRGSIDVDVRRVDDKALEIRVADTGCGIPPEELERVFEEYYQVDNPNRARDHGLGLGLAIVRRLAQVQGGTVALESTLGRGSTFRIRLPCETHDERRREEAAPRPKHAAASRVPLRILYVDDDPDLQDSFAIWAESAGATMMFASQSSEAVAIAADPTTRPDIVIADYRLPGNTHGLDLIDELRRRWTEIPAILLTGDASPSLAQAAADRRVHYVPKPVSPERLEDEILRIAAR